jgi:hypothetical protein
MDVSAIDLATLRQAIAVACTFTTTDEEHALELLRRVPGLADAPEWEVFGGTVPRTLKGRARGTVLPPSLVRRADGDG